MAKSGNGGAKGIDRTCVGLGVNRRKPSNRVSIRLDSTAALSESRLLFLPGPSAFIIPQKIISSKSLPYPALIKNCHLTD